MPSGCWCLNGRSAGYFWSVTCEQAEAPPTVQDIGERFSEFARGFLQGLLAVNSVQRLICGVELQGLNITFSADDLPGECLPKTKKVRSHVICSVQYTEQNTR